MAVIGREAARAPLTSADINDGIVTAADLASTLDLSSKTLTMPSISSLDVTGDLTVDTNTLYVDSANNRVGIGTTSPSSVLHLSTSNDPKITLTDTGFGASADITGSNGNLRLNSQTATIFDMADSEVARIDSSGNLLVGGTTAEAATSTTIYQSGQIVSRVDGTYATEFRRDTSDGDISVFKRGTTTVGSIGSKDSNLVIGTGDTGVRFSSGTNSVFPIDTSTGNGRDAAIDLGLGAGGRFRDLYLSGGVVFPDAGASGTATSNKLDSYEEGTWTPGINYGSPTGTAATLSEAGGSYTKIGRVVTVHAEIDVSNTNSGSGVIYIVGLPFTVADILSPTGLEANGSVSYWTGFSTGVNSLVVAAENNTNFLNILGLTSSNSTAIASVTAAIMGTGEIRLSITYFTT